MPTFVNSLITIIKTVLRALLLYYSDLFIGIPIEYRSAL